LGIDQAVALKTTRLMLVVLGIITIDGAERGLVVEAGEPYRLLPLPAAS
jgi:hypothetical protein